MAKKNDYKIAIFDWDVHHGDGIQEAFYEVILIQSQEKIKTFSLKKIFWKAFFRYKLLIIQYIIKKQYLNKV